MTTHSLFPRVGPFMWLVLQAASVVASILLAFVIDAWWAQRTESAEKNVSLVAIKEDLIEMRAFAKVDRLYREGTRDSAKAVLQAIAVGQYEDNEKTLDHRLGDLLWFSASPELGGAFQSFLLSGHLTAIKNDKLRHALAALPDDVRFFRKMTDQDYETYSEAVAPFLAKKASLAQISNESYVHGMPGHGGGADPEGIVPVAGRKDHSYLLRDPELTGVVLRKLWNSSDVLINLQGYIDTIDELVRLIDQELASTA
jgi:hypothetical protein